jgi:acetate---CoA ligase (ADP-forming)
MTASLPSKAAHRAQADAHRLHALLNPANIVIVGATDRGPTDWACADLRRVGYPGTVYPVNPRRGELWGGTCYASVCDVPEQPDHVLLSVPARAVPAALSEALAVGARSIAIHAAGFGEGGDPEGRALADEVRQIAEKTQVPIAGPGFGGFFRFDAKAMTISLARVTDSASPVALVGQSGGVLMFTYEALTDRSIYPSTVIASGIEMILNCTDYIRYLADDERVRVIGCFIESVKDLEAFRAVAELMRDRGKQLVVLKVGASSGSRAAALAHTGSVVGSLRAFEALAAELGIVIVHTPDELIDAIELLLHAGGLRGPRVGAISHSGGLKDLLMDYATRESITFPALERATLDQLAEVLGTGSSVGNPLDTGFPGLSNPDIYLQCVAAVAADPNVDVVLVQEELPRSPQKQREERYLRSLSAMTQRVPLTKPIGAMSLSSYSLTDHARAVRDELPGIYVLQEARRALSVITKVGRAASAPRRTALHRPSPLAAELRAELNALRRVGERVTLPEHDSKRLLAAYGIPTTSERTAASAAEAVAAASDIGYPVAMKVSAAHLTHKSELGGVLLDIATADDVRAGFKHLAGKLAEADPDAPVTVLVAEYVRGGTELMLGMQHDPEVGPVVAVGSGGVTVELLDDIAVGLPPFDDASASRLVAATKAGRIVAGYRGRPLDQAGLVRALIALGTLACDLGDVLEAVDVNPLTVLEDRVCALDALVVLAPKPAE